MKGKPDSIDRMIDTVKSINAAEHSIKYSSKRLLIDKLIGLRNLSELTQEVLAERMKVPVKFVVNIELLADQEYMTLGELRRYVEGLGLKSVVRIERRTDIR